MRDSAIGTDHTFNPWIGCTKVSDGCKNCYAEEMMDKRFSRVRWGPNGTRQRTSADYWRQPLRWNAEAAAAGARARVFCASLADVFEDRPELDEWRADLFRLIVSTPQLDWLLLTKRPQHVNSMIEHATGFSDAAMWFHAARNVWVGTSVENQATANERIPHLLSIPARVRFLSCEPLLGPVSLSRFLDCSPCGGAVRWVIVGGESGRNARPMFPAWVRLLRNQCAAANVAFFFKQWGEYSPYYEAVDETGKAIGLRDIPGGNVRRVGKSTAGRLLDGVLHNEFPEV